MILFDIGKIILKANPLKANQLLDEVLDTTFLEAVFQKSYRESFNEKCLKFIHLSDGLPLSESKRINSILMYALQCINREIFSDEKTCDLLLILVEKFALFDENEACKALYLAAEVAIKIHINYDDEWGGDDAAKKFICLEKVAKAALKLKRNLAEPFLFYLLDDVKKITDSEVDIEEYIIRTQIIIFKLISYFDPVTALRLFHELRELQTFDLKDCYVEVFDLISLFTLEEAINIVAELDDTSDKIEGYLKIIQHHKRINISKAGNLLDEIFELAKVEQDYDNLIQIAKEYLDIRPEVFYEVIVFIFKEDYAWRISGPQAKDRLEIILELLKTYLITDKEKTLDLFTRTLLKIGYHHNHVDLIDLINKFVCFFPEAIASLLLVKDDPSLKNEMEKLEYLLTLVKIEKLSKKIKLEFLKTAYSLAKDLAERKYNEHIESTYFLYIEMKIARLEEKPAAQEMINQAIERVSKMKHHRMYRTDNNDYLQEIARTLPFINLNQAIELSKSCNPEECTDSLLSISKTLFSSFHQ